MNTNLFKFLLFILILSACFIAGRAVHIDVEHYREILSRYPLAISGLVYIVLYVVITTLIWAVTKDLLRITGALMFGVPVSTLLVIIAESINAAILFHLSRFLGREYVEQKFKINKESLDRAKNNTNILSITALRVNPLIPFRFIDIGYGLTHVDFRKYLLCVVIGSFPRVFWLQMALGKVGMAIFTDIFYVAKVTMEDTFFINYTIIYIGSVIFLSIMAMMFKLKIKKA